MRLILKPSTVLVEPMTFDRPGLVHLPETVKKNSVGLVKDSAYPDVSVGDTVFYFSKAGLKIKTDHTQYLLLDAGDIYARLC